MNEYVCIFLFVLMKVAPVQIKSHFKCVLMTEKKCIQVQMVWLPRTCQDLTAMKNALPDSDFHANIITYLTGHLKVDFFFSFSLSFFFLNHFEKVF